ncbi:hypothetical protein HOY82DRAFT_550971 [Tuber indicum]|nr:hypothetical protein HOY82DRAFT_550971 [Tuber indicum]
MPSQIHPPRLYSSPAPDHLTTQFLPLYFGNPFMTPLPPPIRPYPMLLYTYSSHAHSLNPPTHYGYGTSRISACELHQPIFDGTSLLDRLHHHHRAMRACVRSCIAHWAEKEWVRRAQRIIENPPKKELGKSRKTQLTSNAKGKEKIQKSCGSWRGICFHPPTSDPLTGPALQVRLRTWTSGVMQAEVSRESEVGDETHQLPKALGDSRSNLLSNQDTTNQIHSPSTVLSSPQLQYHTLTKSNPPHLAPPRQTIHHRKEGKESIHHKRFPKPT